MIKIDYPLDVLAMEKSITGAPEYNDDAISKVEQAVKSFDPGGIRNMRIANVALRQVEIRRTLESQNGTVI